MSGTARPWLPETAWTGPAAVEPVARAVEDWSAEWLASGRLTVPFAWQPQAPEAFGSRIRFSAEDTAARFRLVAHSRAEPLLAGAMLGRSLEAQPPRTAADTALVAAVVRTGRTDLMRRIGACLATAADSDLGAPLYELPVSLDEGSAIFTLAVPRDSLISAARLRAAPSRKRPALAARGEALADQPLGMAAVIGRNRVPLADLERLGRGDVIPLDTPTGELLDLSIGSAPHVHRAATIALAGEHFEIRIERPIDQW
jgi:flagellar motor switch/type III secretory pathway protein FliN